MVAGYPEYSPARYSLDCSQYCGLNWAECGGTCISQGTGHDIISVNTAYDYINLSQHTFGSY